MSFAVVTYHQSQFPGAVMADMLNSLETRKVNHKFHYDSVKQTRKWLALHQAYSPSRNDPECEAIYDRSFAAAAALVDRGPVHVAGLGCGGGSKDSRMAGQLLERGLRTIYTPLDVSAAMALVAHETVSKVIGPGDSHPTVADLATAGDLAEVIGVAGVEEAEHIYTFFGMLPNFEPGLVLPRIADLVGPKDTLLLSANLAPGPDYQAGVQQIVPLYDNALTRDWLQTFLFDLGVDSADGELRFSVENDSADSGAARVCAHFHFQRPRELQVAEKLFNFRAGESIRLFYSWRHTPALVRSQVQPLGLRVLDEWITPSGEEGVFLCRRG
jgi:uncharacterized SAM-dependent methyltransferase